MPPDGTLHHATETLRSLLASRRQCGAMLGLLAATALVSPAWAMSSAVAAVGLGLARVAMVKGPGFRDRHPRATASDAYVIGYAREGGEEIRLTRREVERNFLVLGTTGSGKTESLLGLADGFLDKGAGMAFVDGKGDVGLYAKVVALATWYGRSDDVLLINFMTGQGGRSHSFNPFARASQEQLFRLLGVLSVEDEDDGLRSRGKMTTLLSALSGILCHLRDAHGLGLAPSTIHDRLGLDALVRLCDPDGPQRLPAGFIAGLASYLQALEGYDEERGEAQPVTAIQEHATLIAPLERALDAFATVYPHIFETQTPDVDIQDMAANRRILVVGLPALEKSGDELAAMGKVVTAALEAIEMPRSEGRPLRGRAPFLIILDEVGYYLTPGLSAVAARAPETGTCWMFASQDIPALKRLCERETSRLVESCETKLFMRTEEMEVTASLAMHRDGDVRFRDVPMTPDVLDLKGMGAGEMLILRPGMKVFAQCPYRGLPVEGLSARLIRPVHFPPHRPESLMGEAA